MGFPSTIALMTVTSFPDLAQSSSSRSVFSSTFSAKEHSLIATGNKMALSAGIVHVRSAGPEPVCARNQTFGLVWDTLQFLPVSSHAGLDSCGAPSNHFHQITLQSAIEIPNGLESIG